MVKPMSRAGPASVVTEHLWKAFGPTKVLRGLSLKVDAGCVLALLGPSGCGKTTLLRVLAGLERPDSGTVVVGDGLLTGPGTFVPAERRHVGMVFQDGALFPHMTVARNVGYGLPRPDRRGPAVDDALAMVGLSRLGGRYPSELSGGQQQRVALARALAPRPAVLLLDEPFSNLDAALRVGVRAEVLAVLRDVGITSIFVTHDQEEAFVLGDEVAVMRDGVVEQQAPPAALYAEPASRWVATFVGEANLLRGEADAGVAETPIGRVPVTSAVNGTIDVLLRPEAVQVVPGDRGTITALEFYGHDATYDVVLDHGDRVRVRVLAPAAFAVGDRVDLAYAGGPTVGFAATQPRLDVAATT